MKCSSFCASSAGSATVAIVASFRVRRDWLRWSPRNRIAASGGHPYLAPAAYLSSAASLDTGGMQTLVGAAFVGRVREVERLDEALQSAAAGSGATVLLAGEAGIGKSRLTSELAVRARAAGFEVLAGRCL